MKSTQQNIKENKFIHFNNDLMLICDLKQNLLEITLLNNNVQIDQYFYYQKIYTDQSCPKGELGLFDTCKKMYQTFEALKQQNNLILQKGLITIQLKIFFQTIKIQFKLQKSEFTQIQQYIMKNRQAFYIQKIRSQAQDHINVLFDSKIKQCEQIMLKERKLYELTIKMKDQEVKMKDQEIESLKYQIEKLKNQIKSLQLQSIYLKSKQKSTQCESQTSINIENQSKKQKKIRKINQKQCVQENSVKNNTIHTQITFYLKSQLEQIKQQIQTEKLDKLNLNLSRVFHGYARHFCQEFQISVKCVQILKTFNIKRLKVLNLQSNNLGDKGWQILSQFCLPHIQKLYIGNNNLKTISFSLQFQNLKLLNLMSSLESLLMYPNTLSKQSVNSLLLFDWKNLQTLGIDFKSKLISNEYQWSKFTTHNFKNFKKLKVLLILRKNICHLRYQILQKICKQKNIQLQNRGR